MDMTEVLNAFLPLTPAFRQRPKWVIVLRCCLWIRKQKAVLQVLQLYIPVVSVILPCAVVIQHVRVGSLPSGGSRIMIHIVYTPSRIHTPLPAEII